MHRIDYEQIVEPLTYKDKVPEYLRQILDKNEIAKLENRSRVMIELPNRLTMLEFMRERKKDRYKSGSSLSSNKKDSWNGTYTYEDYLDIIEGKADREVKKLADKFEIEFAKKDSNLYQNYTYDTEGYFFDVGKVITGEPEAYLKPVNPLKEQYATVLINVTAHAGIEADLMSANLVKILTVVKKLELHGIKTKLVQITSGRGIRSKADDTNSHTIFTLLKDYSQPFDWVKLYAMLHPAFLRRFVFKVQEVIGHNPSGYGMPEKITNKSIRIDRAGLEEKNILEKIMKLNKHVDYDIIKTSN